MDWFSGVVVFLLVWWTALFVVLPYGVRHNDPHEKKADPKEGIPAAPINPNIKKKFLFTTLLSVVIWIIIYVLIDIEIINFREISMMMKEEDGF